jgi:hypothetical protein
MKEKAPPQRSFRNHPNNHPREALCSSPKTPFENAASLPSHHIADSSAAWVAIAASSSPLPQPSAASSKQPSVPRRATDYEISACKLSSAQNERTLRKRIDRRSASWTRMCQTQASLTSMSRRIRQNRASLKSSGCQGAEKMWSSSSTCTVPARRSLPARGYPPHTHPAGALGRESAPGAPGGACIPYPRVSGGRTSWG